jgi:hypothetical protein
MTIEACSHIYHIYHLLFHELSCLFAANSLPVYPKLVPKSHCPPSTTSVTPLM